MMAGETMVGGLSVTQSLTYAKLQMAAEAFLADKDSDVLVADLAGALVSGNLHASVFPSRAEAETFLDKWKVVAQLPNSGTGFSGTFFRAEKNDEAAGIKAGDYAMSSTAPCF